MSKDFKDFGLVKNSIASKDSIQTEHAAQSLPNVGYQFNELINTFWNRK